MEGLLLELGPLRVSSAAPPRLERNAHSWNLVAGVVYLSSPAGVGLSYPNPTGPIDDATTARQNELFVRAFLRE